MGKRVAIIQSNYIPWKGYFDIINAVDEFMFYDEAQYTRRDWRNRNKIKTPQGTQWLTIPVKVKGRYHQRIDATHISDPGWIDHHLKAIRHNYARAACYEAYFPPIAEAYEQIRGETQLSRINYALTRAVCDLLGITTPLTWSTDYDAEHGKTERLISLCQQCGATEYLSGPSARAYMDHDLFAAANIAIRYVDYGGYPAYEQVHPPFKHAVSILDVLLNVGEAAPQVMKTFGHNDEPPFIEQTQETPDDG